MSVSKDFEVLEKTLSIDEKEWFEKGKIKLIEASYEKRDDNVFLVKSNGTSERIGSLEYWNRIKKFEPKREVIRPQSKSSINERELLNCGLCPYHKNNTALLNIVVTNRCDLRCWYCFFYSEKSGFVYEPSLKEIEKMVLSSRRMNGYSPPVQITGGEPTLRKDIDEIIRLLKKLDVPHIQLNTNSVSIGIDYYINREETVEKLRGWRELGLNTIYTSFDGTSPKTNPKNWWEIPFALEAYREAGISSVVLVPTLLRTNLDEVNKILMFATKNIDVVRGVNFQPISFVGSASSQEERNRIRVVQSDIVDEMKKIGFNITDFFPISSVAVLADLLAKDENHVRFYNNEKCGLATYAFVDKYNKRLIPITNFIDVDGFLSEINSLDSYMGKIKFATKLAPYIILEKDARKGLARYLKKYIIRDELPSGERLSAILDEVITKGNYEALGKFHYQTLFIGMMHFMDPYNYDVRRVERCSIHYGSPDGRVIPFCTYNVFPEIYRDKIMKQYQLKDEVLKKKLIEEEKEASKKVNEFRRSVDKSLIKKAYEL